MMLARQWMLALGYALLAALAVTLTRFDGGVAFLWGASALLIAALVRTSMRNWWAPLVTCSVVGFLVTGFLGLGWAVAPFLLIANMGEAVIAGYLLKRDRSSGELMASLSWFGRFVIAMLVGPVLMAPVAGAVLWAFDGSFVATMKHFAIGHALGNLALTPIAYMMTGRAARKETRRIFKRHKKAALTLLPTVGLIVFFTFWQSDWPILFLPVMWVVLVTFRLGRLGAAVSLALLTGIGGLLTAKGMGPVSLTGATLGDRMQFFQFYLAATVLTVIPIAADLHNRQKLNRSLRRSEAEFRLLADHCTDVIMRISIDGQILYASPSVELVTGYHPSELVGRHSRVLIDPADFARVRDEHRATLAAGGEPRTYAYRTIVSSGEQRWFSTHGRALLDEYGEPIELLSYIRDITGAKADEREWVQAALTDSLTGLHNRRAFERAADGRIAAGAVGADCVALFDLDRFKSINDRFGHDAGDDVLKRFAEVALKLTRPGDMLARIGGEEFGLLFEDTSIGQAYEICERIRREVSGTLRIAEVQITVSGGVAPIGPDGLAAALKSADEALYRAKQGGRDQLLLAA
ncbi:sensor domain-containing diguanylate cyclase [Sphingomonas glaciei]|uniref:Diguanylate cyclase n=1 Tax=Sphingomonas glaciei TaxID=2938948 RepID=A0ABY5MXR3_9SPHN|nr:sensor domain-containing diguanylate cyclase [Sphingomonas glaciei]UUR09245.1 diguanylate cyclase [Sphingomonas glaciei]